MPEGSSRSNNAARAFEAFLEGWLAKQDTLLQELLARQDDDHEEDNDLIRGLISRVLSHYQEYFEEKSRMAYRNIFLMFSPPWFTPLEKAFLWVGGFKPCLALSLVFASVDNLTPEQTERLEELRYETRAEERLLVEDFAKIQESVAAPPLAELARDGVGGRAVEALRSGMENLVSQADGLRTRTAEKVVSVLRPVQSVRFLAAAAQLQFRIRSLGIQKETERFRSAANINGW